MQKSGSHSLRQRAFVLSLVDSSSAVEQRRSCLGNFSEPWKGTGVLVLYSTPLGPYSTPIVPWLHRGLWETKLEPRGMHEKLAADAVQPSLCYLRKQPSTDLLANCV